MGDKFYYKDGTTSSEYSLSKALHREDGPAIEYASGNKQWYINNLRHREDGPAVENDNGDKGWLLNRVWYINGRLLNTLSKKQLIKYMEANNFTVAHLLTDSDELVRTSAAKYDWNK